MKRIINTLLILSLSFSVYSQSNDILKPIAKKVPLQKVYAYPSDGSKVIWGYYHRLEDNSLILKSTKDSFPTSDQLIVVNPQLMEKIGYRNHSNFRRGGLVGGIIGLVIGGSMGLIEADNQRCQSGNRYCRPGWKALILGLPAMGFGTVIGGSITGAKSEIYLNGNHPPNKLKLYMSGTLGYGNTGELRGIGITAVLPNRWGLAAGYKFNKMDQAINTPAYYRAPIGFFSSFGSEYYLPNDYSHSYSLRLVKEFPIPRTLFRFGLEAGPSWMVYQEAVFEAEAGKVIPRLSGSLWDRYEVESAPGLMLRAKLIIPYPDVGGWEIAGIANINKLKPYVGLECGFNLGSVR